MPPPGPCLPFTRVTHTVAGRRGVRYFDPSRSDRSGSAALCVHGSDRHGGRAATRYDTKRRDRRARAGSFTRWYIFYDRSCSVPLCACAADNNNIGRGRARLCVRAYASSGVGVRVRECVYCVCNDEYAAAAPPLLTVFIIVVVIIFFAPPPLAPSPLPCVRVRIG